MEEYRTHAWCVMQVNMLVGIPPRTGSDRNAFTAHHAERAYSKGTVDAFRYLTGFFHHTDPILDEPRRGGDLSKLIVEALKRKQAHPQHVADAMYLLIS